MSVKRKAWLIKTISMVFLSSLLFIGCSPSQSSTSDSPTSNDTGTTTEISLQNTNTNTKNMFPNLSRLEGMAKVELVINGSPVILEINGNEAPITAGNFVDLVSRGFYDGLIFHRVVKEPQPFVAQGGDPQGTGTGGFVDENGKKRSIPLEIKIEGESEPRYSKGLGQQSGISDPPVVLKHDRGALAMARSMQPDSASSQFYIALADIQFLNGDYAVFGKVLEGMNVVDEIEQGTVIDSAKVLEGGENLKQP